MNISINFNIVCHVTFFLPSTDAVIKLWLDGIALVCVVKEFLEIG